MNARLLIVFFALSVTISSHAEDAPKADQIEPLVRAFVFKSIPNLNTNGLEIRIRNFEVKGLWEELKIEAFDVELLGDGTWFNGFEGIYHDGKISVIAPTFGGYGLMSGLVSKGKFYYTYSWGSGIHRSHVAVLRITKGELETLQSTAFPYEDLFVSSDSGGRVRVLLGTFVGFNHWDSAKEIGFLGSTNSSELQIFDAEGKVVTPLN